MPESWTSRYFDEVYLQRWALGPPGEAEYRHVDFLLDRLSANRGDSLLDVGCGQERYSLAFASRGIRVTGLDASPSLLQEARQMTAQAGIEVDWILGDMRALPSTGAYRFAVLFDAFGCFDTEEENEIVIHEMARATEPEGRVVLAVVNGPRILNAFEPVGREERNGRVTVLRRELDAGRPVVREEVTVTEGGSQHSAERRQRLYSRAELADIAARAGLTVDSVYGDLEGATFNEATSGKIVLICRRGSRPSMNAVSPPCEE
jgi:SAM-dependent methyltransferase